MPLNFRKTTDDLFARIGIEDVAQEMDCSAASIKQARLGEGALARRTPPKGWEKAVLRLAEKQLAHFQKLVAKIRASE